MRIRNKREVDRRGEFCLTIALLHGCGVSIVDLTKAFMLKIDMELVVRLGKCVMLSSVQVPLTKSPMFWSNPSSVQAPLTKSLDKGFHVEIGH